MLTPESKLGVWERWLDTVYMPECAGLKLRQMYEDMDVLAEHAAEIEREIFFQVADLMTLLNELPKGAVSLLKSLAIPLPKRVFGIQRRQKTGAMT